tara:strand:- start:381 stop:1028 length:648 start_codon:yes stop_codon:yes gene_type:complete
MDHFIVDNLKQIKNEVLLKKKDCKIIAVSKTFQIEKIRPLLEFGHIDFGENKVQEAIDKWSNIKNEFKQVKLHMIGKLQTNKVKKAVKIFDYIHSVDSFKLAKKISNEQNEINKRIKLFIQLNINNEKQKSGIFINELNDFYQSMTKELKLDIVGLMCIPDVERKSTEAFTLMKSLCDKLGLKEISMGMSSDYLDAIDYGSTFVRIGTKIFGKRD